MFDYQKLRVYFRDRIVDFKDANISIACTGFLYGLGVFTGMRVHLNENKNELFLFRPEDHYKRFYNACKLCNYQNFLQNFTYEKFLSTIKNLQNENKLKQDFYIRVTNFTDENVITPKFVGYRDSLCMYFYPLGDYVPTTGMRCCVSSWKRVPDNCIPARAKFNGIYVNTAFAKTQALLNGYDEAIFLDGNGHAVEGSAENLFIVLNGNLITPPVSDDILEGITRDSVINIAKQEGITVVERSIDRTELYKAEEVFFTGTGAKVSPVVEIDKYKVGNGQIGEISKKIQTIYQNVVRGEDSRFLNWLTQI